MNICYKDNNRLNNNTNYIHIFYLMKIKVNQQKIKKGIEKKVNLSNLKQKE